MTRTLGESLTPKGMSTGLVVGLAMGGVALLGGIAFLALRRPHTVEATARVRSNPSRRRGRR